MQAIAVAVLLALVGLSVAAPGYEHDHHAYPKYKYSYRVNDKHTGDYKTAHEYRDGDVTKGSYSVLQPDGILRTVNYVVDPKGGFQAEVVNKGHAHHAPVYAKKSHDAGHGYAHGHGHAYAHVSHHGHGGFGDGGFGGAGGFGAGGDGGFGGAGGAF